MKHYSLIFLAEAQLIKQPIVVGKGKIGIIYGANIIRVLDYFLFIHIVILVRLF